MVLEKSLNFSIKIQWEPWGDDIITASHCTSQNDCDKVISAVRDDAANRFYQYSGKKSFTFPQVFKSKFSLQNAALLVLRNYSDK